MNPPAPTRAHLADALTNDGFRLGYQLQVELRTGRVVGVEALLRLKGYAPDEFVPVAEESGLIVPLGTWVLREALRQLAEWDASGEHRLHMSVNLSGHQLGTGFVAVVLGSLRDFGIPAHRLTIELTETILMTSGASIRELYEFQDAGVYLSVDDFGTGYSSLAYLRQLPVEIIKIDRNFVSGLPSGRIDQPVVEAILGLATAMGLHVVAEGIETAAQARSLVSSHCEVGQGFLFGPVLPPNKVLSVAREGIDAHWSEPFQTPRRAALRLLCRLHRSLRLVDWDPLAPRRRPPWGDV